MVSGTRAAAHAVAVEQALVSAVARGRLRVTGRARARTCVLFGGRARAGGARGGAGARLEMLEGELLLAQSALRFSCTLLCD